MDNYDVVVDPQRPLARRTLVPADTFDVDPESGEPSTFVPDALRFTQDGKVRPVAPFLEAWALTDGDQLEPLTIDLLASNGLTPDDVEWTLHVGNHKLFRRTGDPADRIEAKLAVEGHARLAIEATCANFWPDRVLPLGFAQFVRPPAAQPAIRLRFTPAGGRVYGSSKEPPGVGPPADPNIAEV